MTANSFDMSQGGDAGKVLFGLVCVVAIAWIYLLAGVGVEMEQMGMGGGKMMLMSPTWRPSYAALVFAMWAIMMVAMMLPSAAPAILKAVSLAHKRPEGVGGISTALFFAAGYLIVWTGFNFAATLLQWAPDSAHLLPNRSSWRT